MIIPVGLNYYELLIVLGARLPYLSIGILIPNPNQAMAFALYQFSSRAVFWHPQQGAQESLVALS